MTLAAAALSGLSAPVSSQWISANAGSGKTTVLTRQVVRLLLLGVPPERICCITYTKAAAGEMRHRVLKSLRQLLLMSDREVEAEINDPGKYGLQCTPSMLARARLLFGTVLDSPTGGIQLTTIHGFCQHVLRAFPLEADVAPHFTVLDDMQQMQLHQQVKNRLLSQQRLSPELAEAIALLAERSGETKFDMLVKKLLEVDLGCTSVEQWIGQLYDHLEVEPGTREEDLAAAAMDCLSEPQKQILRAELPRLASEKTAYKRDFAAAIEPWLRGECDVDGWLEIWLNTSSPTIVHWFRKGEFAPGTPFGDTVAYCLEAVERFMAQRATLALAQESAAALRLAAALQDIYKQLKAERGVLDYADLITKTRELFTIKSVVSWVMTKLDHRIDHLLIDEAQDTSDEQWRIAYALVDELKEADGSAGVPRTTFVVGDEKQSIFSFQGADPELYAQKKHEFVDLLQFASARMEEKELKKSYRSAPAILNVVDAVARQPEVAAALSSVGAPQTHEAVHANKAGRVVLHPLIEHVKKTAEKADDDQPWRMPQEYAIARSNAQLLAETVADQVKGWIDAGEWSAGDILILTRKRHPIVQPLLRALQQRNVAVAGLDRLVLSRHLAVKDLMALARWCASTHDDLALAHVLRSPLLGWSDEQLRSVAVHRAGLPLWRRVSETNAAETLERWRTASLRSAYEFLTTVLEVDDARTRFVARFGAEVHEILDELKQQAMAMPVGLAPTTANFAAWISASDRQIKREMEAGGHDHVRVMTVHGSKGLEARCVVMVDVASLPRTDKELMRKTPAAPLIALSDSAKTAPAWERETEHLKHAQRKEYYRLLYVAMTRASEALHVFTAEQGNERAKPDCWHKVIERSLKEMGGVIEMEGRLEYTNTGVKDVKPALETSPQTAGLPAWVTTRPPLPQLRATLSPSGLGREALAPFRKTRGENARERGVRLHRVLEFLRADSTRAQVEALIAHLAPDWPQEEQQRAAGEVWALFDSHRWLWQHEAQAEANICGSITLQGKPYAVLGQIDRLVVTPTEVIVLDYKTGRDVPATSHEVGEGYLLQLKLYQTLLETLYPGKRVRPAIVWTANARLMWLDEAVAAIGWERANLPQIP